MSLMVWMGVGGVCAVVVGIWALIRSGRPADVKDLGGVSEQWTNEQRSHDTEWRHR